MLVVMAYLPVTDGAPWHALRGAPRESGVETVTSTGLEWQPAVLVLGLLVVFVLYKGHVWAIPPTRDGERYNWTQILRWVRNFNRQYVGEAGAAAMAGRGDLDVIDEVVGVSGRPDYDLVDNAQDAVHDFTPRGEGPLNDFMDILYNNRNPFAGHRPWQPFTEDAWDRFDHLSHEGQLARLIRTAQNEHELRRPYPEVDWHRGRARHFNTVGLHGPVARHVLGADPPMFRHFEPAMAEILPALRASWRALSDAQRRAEMTELERALHVDVGIYDCDNPPPSFYGNYRSEPWSVRCLAVLMGLGGQ